MAVPGVKQVSRTGSSLQGGSTSAGTRLQNTVSGTSLQRTVSGSTLQNAATTPRYQQAASAPTYSAPRTSYTAPTNNQPLYQAPPPPPPDPYERWGGYAGYQRAVSDYEKTKGLTYGSITDSINDTVLGTKSSILDFITGYGQQQKGIDKQAVRSELGRETKRIGILDMIGQGLRNGQVMLNNKNASSSSANEQISKAYGRMGQKQMIAANTGYNLEQEDIGDAQEALGISLETFKRKYGEDKQTATNKIVQNAVAALSGVDQMASGSGLDSRINIEAEKNRIRNEAMSALGALDTVFNDGVAKVKPSDRATNRAEAFKLMNSGYVPENKMGFETTLPIYTLGA